MKCSECNGRGHFLLPLSTPTCDSCEGTGQALKGFSKALEECSEALEEFSKSVGKVPINIIGDSRDPSQKGYSAPLGSIWTGDLGVWVKTGPDSTDWEPCEPPQ